MKHKQTKIITYSALSAALIAAGAFIKIQMPFGLAMTLQLFFVILSGFLIGKYAALAALSYMIIGLLGVPIFSLGGGFSYVLQPSFGYILSFIPAGFLVGKLTERQDTTFLKYLFTAVLGIILIYVIGIAYFSIIYKVYLHKAVTAKLIFVSLFLSLIWKDIVLAIFACVVAVRIRKIVRL